MHVLFICTHNRCRSVLSEAITNHLGAGRLTASSAGSHPAEAVHPLTLKYLQAHGYPVAGLSSKSWDNLAGATPELVITVCDQAANEACPVWLGPTAKVHWGLPDPSRVQGDETAVADAFNEVIARIEKRVRDLLELPLETLTGEALGKKIRHLSEDT